MRVSDWSSDVCSSDFATCHQPGHWKPATFDHSRYFLLDRDHNTACTTCHMNNNYKQYTCYGCHEHQPTKIITKHREEGITHSEKCVRSHRSAHGEAAREHEGARREDKRSITRLRVPSRRLCSGPGSYRLAEYTPAWGKLSTV